MKVSLNWIKQFTEVDLPIDELVEKIGSQLGAVEEVIDLGKKYQGITIVKVVECKELTSSDHLHVCKIDDGHKVKDVERGSDGFVQVVCGAPNVREGLTVAWLPPGTTVPESFDKDPLVLEAREIRGQKSNGMLASAAELAISDDHSGLLEIDYDCRPGTAFAEAYKLNDYVIDIENKMFTHRPDCFGALGLAREIAGILNRPFYSPKWYREETSLAAASIIPESLPLLVGNKLPDLVPRFMVVAMSDVKVGPSPVWLQVALAKVGQKPINNIVDLTNFYMLVTGQPLHAYDYDKVKARSGNTTTIVVRYPKKGEKLKLLNGKEIEPRAEAIMIATDKQLIGVGGVMGGSETEVDGNTKNIILECATFDMYSIRRTSMEHGLFTDAATRFTKGQSPRQNEAVLERVITDIQQLTGASVASAIVDSGELVNAGHQSFRRRATALRPIHVTTAFINERLGLNLKPAEMKRLLENVEFAVHEDKAILAVTPPFWRTDIEIPEDIVEEIGRLQGFDKLPLELPRRTITPAKKDELLELKSRIRTLLAKAGANEVLTYSFVHGDLLKKVGQDPDDAFQLSNALSPDLQYYRLSLTPSLLDKVHSNIKAGFDEFAIFELGKAHVLNEPDPHEPEVPKEVNALSFVYTSKKPQAGAPYYEARKYLFNLLVEFQASSSIKLEPLADADLYKNPWIEQMIAPFEPTRSAVLRDTVGVLPGTKGLIWGVVGEFKLAVRQALKLPNYTAGFEIDPLLLLQAESSHPYTPLPRFPKVTQDITLKVPESTSHQDLINFFWQEYKDIEPEKVETTLSSLNIYMPDENAEFKNVTLRFTIASYERTLTDSEVAKLLDAVAAAAQQKLKAERI